jgi:hypothetical protein
VNDADTPNDISLQLRRRASACCSAASPRQKFFGNMNLTMPAHVAAAAGLRHRLD